MVTSQPIDRVCVTLTYRFKVAKKFRIRERKKRFFFYILRRIVSHHKKNSFPLLFLTIGKLSYFIGYSSLNLINWLIDSCKKGPRLDHIFNRLGPALPHLLHYMVFLPALVWELMSIGNQCVNTLSFKPLSARSLKPLNSFGM